jgi:hypothetical protein
MVGRYSKNMGYWYYCCSAHEKHYDLENRCQQKKIRGDYLEVYVWSYVLDLLTDRNRFEAALRDAQESERQAAQPKQERLETIYDLIAECEAESEEISAILAQVPKDGLMSRTIKSKITELENRYAGLCEERDQIERELNTQQFTDEDISGGLQFREDVITGMQNPTFEDMRRCLEILRLRVIIQGTEGKLKCIIPAGEISFDLCTLPSICISSSPLICAAIPSLRTRTNFSPLSPSLSNKPMQWL